MPPKRKRVSVTAQAEKSKKKYKALKTSQALQAAISPPGLSPPLPTEILCKTFTNLDVLTATSFSLANKQFNEIYKSLAKTMFEPHLLPLWLNYEVQEPGQKKIFLKQVIREFFPPHLTFWCEATSDIYQEDVPLRPLYVGKFVSDHVVGQEMWWIGEKAKTAIKEKEDWERERERQVAAQAAAVLKRKRRERERVAAEEEVDIIPDYSPGHRRWDRR